MRTTIQSESTRVPPVTAERSPPLSRITGADSPVIADSSTEATPSTTSPSPGISSPASTSTRSPLRSFGAATPRTGRRASAGRRSWREALGQRLAACAAQGVGLRLAAPLGHRLGEVGEEDGEPQPERDREDEAALTRQRWGRSASASNSMVVTTLPTSTTNMTGLRACTRGSSFLNASTMARRDDLADRRATRAARTARLRHLAADTARLLRRRGARWRRLSGFCARRSRYVESASSRIDAT